MNIVRSEKLYIFIDVHMKEKIKKTDLKMASISSNFDKFDKNISKIDYKLENFHKDYNKLKYEIEKDRKKESDAKKIK